MKYSRKVYSSFSFFFFKRSSSIIFSLSPQLSSAAGSGISSPASIPLPARWSYGQRSISAKAPILKRTNSTHHLCPALGERAGQLYPLLRLHSIKICSCVVPLAHPAQIACAVVKRIAVNVVNCRVVLRVFILTKSLRYKAAHKPIFRYAILRQTNALISFVVYKGFLYSCAGMFQTFHSRKIADKVFIITFNLFPYFSW